MGCAASTTSAKLTSAQSADARGELEQLSASTRAELATRVAAVSSELSEAERALVARAKLGNPKKPFTRVTPVSLAAFSYDVADADGAAKAMAAAPGVQEKMGFDDESVAGKLLFATKQEDLADMIQFLCEALPAERSAPLMAAEEVAKQALGRQVMRATDAAELKDLLAQGPPKYYVDCVGTEMLTLCTREHSVEKLELLCSAGYLVNVQGDEQITAQHSLAKNNYAGHTQSPDDQLAMMRLLLAKGASLEMRDEDERSPLMIAQESAASGCETAKKCHAPTLNLLQTTIIPWEKIEALLRDPNLGVDERLHTLFKLGFGTGRVFHGLENSVRRTGERRRLVNPACRLCLFDHARPPVEEKRKEEEEADPKKKAEMAKKKEEEEEKFGTPPGSLLASALLVPLVEMAGDERLDDSLKDLARYALESRVLRFCGDEGRAAVSAATDAALSKLQVSLDRLQATLRVVPRITAQVNVLVPKSPGEPPPAALHQEMFHPRLPWLETKNLVEAYAALHHIGAIDGPAAFCALAKDAGGLYVNQHAERLWTWVYLDWLLGVARLVDAPFQASMQRIFGPRYHPAPLKTKTRVRAKLVDDFKDKGLAFPGTKAMLESHELTYAAGTLLDYVRGAVACATEAHVVEAIKDLEAHFRVARIKNLHHPDAETVGGYRDVKVIVAYPLKAGEATFEMLCEVQLILAGNLVVKESMHLLYGMKRGDYGPT